MRKETIIKYEKEFLAWCKDESVLLGAPASMHDKTLIWREVRDFNDWKPLDTVYVLNDAYSDYRKALAEGKTIQCNAKEGENDITYTAYGDTWWVDTTEFKYATRFYRIKPEKPKFKVGDWVIIDFIRLDINDKYKYCKAQIKGIKNNNYYYDKECTSLISELPENTGDWVITKLWKPQLGEWCWVGYKLMKFNKLIKKDYSTTFEFISPDRDADGYKIKKHILERHLQVVEPFIGQLPSYLKE